MLTNSLNTITKNSLIFLNDLSQMTIGWQTTSQPSIPDIAYYISGFSNVMILPYLPGTTAYINQVQIMQMALSFNPSLLFFMYINGQDITVYTNSAITNVVAATTIPITLSGEQTIDGVLTSSSLVLVKNQADTTTNGLYTSNSSTWTLTTPFTSTSAIPSGNSFQINAGGTVNGLTSWVCNSNGMVGTNPITFTKNIGYNSSTGSTYYPDPTIQINNTIYQIINNYNLVNQIVQGIYIDNYDFNQVGIGSITTYNPIGYSFRDVQIEALSVTNINNLNLAFACAQPYSYYNGTSYVTFQPYIPRLGSSLLGYQSVNNLSYILSLTTVPSTTNKPIYFSSSTLLVTYSLYGQGLNYTEMSVTQPSYYTRSGDFFFQLLTITQILLNPFNRGIQAMLAITAYDASQYTHQGGQGSGFWTAASSPSTLATGDAQVAFNLCQWLGWSSIATSAYSDFYLNETSATSGGLISNIFQWDYNYNYFNPTSTIVTVTPYEVELQATPTQNLTFGNLPGNYPLNTSNLFINENIADALVWRP